MRTRYRKTRKGTRAVESVRELRSLKYLYVVLFQKIKLKCINIKQQHIIHLVLVNLYKNFLNNKGVVTSVLIMDNVRFQKLQKKNIIEKMDLEC